MNVPRLEGLRREDVRRVEHRLAAQLADAGFQPRLLGLLHAGGLALLRHDFGHSAALRAIGVIDEGHGLQQTGAVLVWNTRKHSPVGSDGFEQFGRVAQSFDQSRVNVRRGSHSHPA